MERGITRQGVNGRGESTRSMQNGACLWSWIGTHMTLSSESDQADASRTNPL